MDLYYVIGKDQCPEKGKLGIKVATFSNLEVAEDYRKELRKEYYDAILLSAEEYDTILRYDPFHNARLDTPIGTL